MTTPTLTDAQMNDAIRDVLGLDATEAVGVMQRFIYQAAHDNGYAAGLAAGDKWREAVIDELVVAHIYSKAHDDDPRKAIQDAITWNCRIALDPLVSSDARALIDRGLAAGVPREPTIAMIRAGCESFVECKRAEIAYVASGGQHPCKGPEHIWRAMYDAAPRAQARAQDQSGGATNTREKGLQYGQGVPTGEPQGNPCEVAKVRRPDPTTGARGGAGAMESAPHPPDPIAAPPQDVDALIARLPEIARTGTYPQASNACFEAAAALAQMRERIAELSDDRDSWQRQADDRVQEVIGASLRASDAKARAERAEADVARLTRERDEWHKAWIGMERARGSDYARAERLAAALRSIANCKAKACPQCKIAARAALAGEDGK